jgi:hypothetical protein
MSEAIRRSRIASWSFAPSRLITEKGEVPRGAKLHTFIATDNDLEPFIPSL